MSDLDQAFRATEKNVEQGLKAVEDYAQRLQTDDRSLIAKLLICAFVALIVLVAVIVATGTVLQTWDKWVEPSKFFLGILSSVLLPVVTLVIGYYFGKEK